MMKSDYRRYLNYPFQIAIFALRNVVTVEDGNKENPEPEDLYDVIEIEYNWIEINPENLRALWQITSHHMNVYNGQVMRPKEKQDKALARSYIDKMIKIFPQSTIISPKG